jgi:hypothetical protein
MKVDIEEDILEDCKREELLGSIKAGLEDYDRLSLRLINQIVYGDFEVEEG